MDPVRPWVIEPEAEVDASLVGGKAASLMRLHQAGVPVPTFAVVSTEAYRAVVAPTATTMEAVSHPHGVPEALAGAIAEAAGRVAGPDARIAVRSSATVEDLETASFAGQYHSELNVVVPDDVVPAVGRVWDSLCSPAAVQYRARLEAIAAPSMASPPAMAVVLMRQVSAVRSGVAFTRDPVGAPDCVRVEMVAGTAEHLVAGAQTPEVRLVPRQVIVHDDPVVAEVIAWSLRCEELLGRPQDVEWVWDGTRVLIVQSRPITSAAPGADIGPGRNPEQMTAAVAEMLPAPLPPLIWDTAVLAVDHGMMALFHHLGALPEIPVQGPGLVVRANGAAGLRVAALADAAARLPSTTPEQLEAQLLGRSAVSGLSGRLSTPWRQRVAHDLRVARVRARVRADTDVVVGSVARLTADQSFGSEFSALSAQEVWRERQRHVDLLLRAAETEIAVSALAAAAFDRLVQFLEPYVGPQATAMASRLTQATVTSPTVSRWTHLAECLRSRPMGRDVLDEAVWTDARQRLLNGGDVGRTLLDIIERELRYAGSRAVPGGVTWAEEPERAWEAVRAAAQMSARLRPQSGCDVPETLRSLTESDRWRRRRLVTGLVIDSQQVLLRRHTVETAALLQSREDLKAAMLALGGVVRDLHRRLGQIAVGEGWLSDPAELAQWSAHEINSRLVRRDDQVEAQRHELRGWPASSGSYVGTAQLVTSPEDPLDAGDILVAFSTDPSWSPLFLKAGALVVELGGPLSHAAVIARELGLPAVVNVADLTRHVTSGTKLRVDGDTGLVEILSEV